MANEEKASMKNAKLHILVIMAFASGTLTHAVYAKNSAVIVMPPTLAEETEQQELITGHASWYSKKSPGIRKHTANMEIFDDTAMTCAMWGVPFNQQVRVTNLENGKSVVVRVNDRGPHKRYVHKGRVIDLSKAAFQSIAGLKQGLVKVQLQLL